jgi:hypothetical protein
MPYSLYSQRKTPQYPLDGSEIALDMMAKRESVPLKEIKPHTCNS